MAITNRTICNAIALMTTFGIPANTYADTGYTSKSINVPHRTEPVRLDIYFPAQQSAETTLHGANAVFKGITITKNAKPTSGKHPVVIFSHGSGGNGINTGWFAKALADRGMIVIAPNHPGTTSGDSNPEETLKTWERPQDISSVIDQLPEILSGDLRADPDRIAAAGFSLGGYSVLALAGAKVSKQAFIDHCDRNMNKGLNECGWLTKDGFDLKDTDQKRFEQGYMEPRISAIVSIDPGLAAAFTGQSLAAVNRPVKIINLGTSETLYAGVNGKPLAAKIPGAEYHDVKEAWHFDFLGQCTSRGPYILKVTFDDPICDGHGNRTRADIHEEIAAETLEFLESQFAMTN